MLSGVYVNYERGDHPPHYVETRVKNRKRYLTVGGFQPWRLEVSDGKPVYSKLSIISGVKFLRRNSSTAYNAGDKHVSTVTPQKVYTRTDRKFRVNRLSVGNF